MVNKKIFEVKNVVIFIELYDGLLSSNIDIRFQELHFSNNYTGVVIFIEKDIRNT